MLLSIYDTIECPVSILNSRFDGEEGVSATSGGLVGDARPAVGRPRGLRSAAAFHAFRLRRWAQFLRGIRIVIFYQFQFVWELPEAVGRHALNGNYLCPCPPSSPQSPLSRMRLSSETSFQVRDII